MTVDFAADVRQATIDRIAILLDYANARRRERILSVDSVLSCLRDVATGDEFSCVHAGSVAASYRQRAVTTYAVVARVDGRIYLGIRAADAKSTSPGRAFSCLQPWRKDGPAGDAAAKWAAFPSCSNVIELSGAEIDAFLED